MVHNHGYLSGSHMRVLYAMWSTYREFIRQGDFWCQLINVKYISLDRLQSQCLVSQRHSKKPAKDEHVIRRAVLRRNNSYVPGQRTQLAIDSLLAKRQTPAVRSRVWKEASERWGETVEGDQCAQTEGVAHPFAVIAIKWKTGTAVKVESKDSMASCHLEHCKDPLAVTAHCVSYLLLANVGYLLVGNDGGMSICVKKLRVVSASRQRALRVILRYSACDVDRKSWIVLNPSSSTLNATQSREQRLRTAPVWFIKLVRKPSTRTRTEHSHK